MSNWLAAYVDDKLGNSSIISTVLPQLVNDYTTKLTSDLTGDIIYFSAPEAYLGKKLTAYGGPLNYTVRYTTGPWGEAIEGADVILQGNDITLYHYAEEQPPSDTLFSVSVDLVESNFYTSKLLHATREQIMLVLKDIKGIYIRANYWKPSLEMT